MQFDELILRSFDTFYLFLIFKIAQIKELVRRLQHRLTTVIVIILDFIRLNSL
jgi:hypothetical protein